MRALSRLIEVDLASGRSALSRLASRESSTTTPTRLAGRRAMLRTSATTTRLEPAFTGPDTGTTFLTVTSGLRVFAVAGVAPSALSAATTISSAASDGR